MLSLKNSVLFLVTSITHVKENLSVDWYFPTFWVKYYNIIGNKYILWFYITSIARNVNAKNTWISPYIYKKKFTGSQRLLTDTWFSFIMHILYYFEPIFSFHFSVHKLKPFTLLPCQCRNSACSREYVFMPVFLLKDTERHINEASVIIIAALLSCQFVRQGDRSDLLAALGRKIKAVDLWSMVKQPANVPLENQDGMPEKTEDGTLESLARTSSVFLRF